MKISKLILACVLGGIVGNAFAEPVRIVCKYDDHPEYGTTEVEFDDNSPNQFSVDGRILPYNYITKKDNIRTKVKFELKEFNASSIAWFQEAESNLYDDIKSRLIRFFEINRKTGRMTYTVKYYSSLDKIDISTFRGTCTKMANNGF